MKNSLEIGNRIRSIRESMNLNRDLFSEKINISEVFLAQVERGEKSISLKTLISICENTGYSSDYILFGNIDNNSTARKTLRLLDELPPDVNLIVYNVANSLKELSKDDYTYNKSRNKVV